jgi:hypothetical protein
VGDTITNCTVTKIWHQIDFEYPTAICQVQGGYIAASGVQMLVGMSGLVGVLVRYIGPLTIAPLMALLMITITDKALEQMSTHWISLLSVFSSFLLLVEIPTFSSLVLLLLFTLYLCDLLVPVPSISFSPYTVTTKRMRIFGMFPVQ